MPSANSQRVGVGLLLLFTVGWLLTMLTIQFVQAARHGYGSGIGNGGRVPAEIVRQAGVGADAEAVARATNRP